MLSALAEEVSKFEARRLADENDVVDKVPCNVMGAPAFPNTIPAADVPMLRIPAVVGVSIVDEERPPTRFKLPFMLMGKPDWPNVIELADVPMLSAPVVLILGEVRFPLTTTFPSALMEEPVFPMLIELAVLVPRLSVPEASNVLVLTLPFRFTGTPNCPSEMAVAVLVPMLRWPVVSIVGRFRSPFRVIGDPACPNVIELADVPILSSPVVLMLGDVKFPLMTTLPGMLTGNPVFPKVIALAVLVPILSAPEASIVLTLTLPFRLMEEADCPIIRVPVGDVRLPLMAMLLSIVSAELFLPIVISPALAPMVKAVPDESMDGATTRPEMIADPSMLTFVVPLVFPRVMPLAVDAPMLKTVADTVSRVGVNVFVLAVKIPDTTNLPRTLVNKFAFPTLIADAFVPPIVKAVKTFVSKTGLFTLYVNTPCPMVVMVFALGPM